MNAVKHLLRYLSTTLNLKLNYFQTREILKAFVDTNWDGNSMDRKSYTSFTFIIASAPISLKSKNRNTIALNSTEAEYVALSEACKELVYVRCFIEELGFRDLVSTPPKLYAQS